MEIRSIVMMTEIEIKGSVAQFRQLIELAKHLRLIFGVEQVRARTMVVTDRGRLLRFWVECHRSGGEDRLSRQDSESDSFPVLGV